MSCVVREGGGWASLMNTCSTPPALHRGMRPRGWRQVDSREIDAVGLHHRAPMFSPARSQASVCSSVGFLPNETRGDHSPEYARTKSWNRTRLGTSPVAENRLIKSSP